ncbi:uncharacterized protein LOC122282541 [Carya illinoinensis]|uniref:uncharacterized protein LOC122282541 n=1 Tax=Carya illinoinensis TaxID=32201 RepID=UPI001C71E4FF|nr:uncharacterized protein LOC122282541 [Carya illinoinensis]
MSSYLVEDEVRIQEFTKQVTYSMDFNVDAGNAKCSCGLFQMRGILCRHILAVFKSNGIKSLPEGYILEQWRKDIKRRYTLIRSSYDAGDERANGNRHSILLNMCYEMIDYAVESNEQFEDAKKRIHEMTGLYRQNRSPLSMNSEKEPATTLDTAAVVGSSQGVKSPLVVRGKGRPPSLRRASKMETDMWKVKAKQIKAQAGGKRKQRDEGDTAPMGTCRNLFRASEVDITNSGEGQVMDSISATQSHPMFGTQESVMEWKIVLFGHLRTGYEEAGVGGYVQFVVIMGGGNYTMLQLGVNSLRWVLVICDGG